jgi:hypothetical protein
MAGFEEEGVAGDDSLDEDMAAFFGRYVSFRRQGLYVIF